MTSSPFKQLLQDSKKLTHFSNNNDILQLNRNLDQVSTESHLLSSKFAANQELNANAHYFLAQGGSNSHEVVKSLKTINTDIVFKTSDVIKHTNVEGHLKKIQEDYIKETTHEARIKAQQTLDNRLREQLHANVGTIKAQILEDWDEEEDNRLFGHKGVREDASYKQRVASYTSIIHSLNEHRIRSEKMPVFSQLKHATQLIECTKAQRICLEDAWDVATYVANEDDLYAEKIYSKHQQDPIQAAKTNRMLISRVKRWLEKQYLMIANKELVLGGSPSAYHRVHALSKLLAKDITAYLDLDDDTPIWLFVYLLFRIGQPQLAYDYVENNQTAFRHVPAFFGYLKEYVHADHKLSAPTRQRVNEHYLKMTYGNSQVDPYQRLMYKIIGRCEPHSNVSDVNLTLEDFVWLQYSLMDENPLESETDRYRLLDLQRTVIKGGPDHFDAKTNPCYYFYVLVLTLQFERAVAFMYTQPSFRLEAIHFAIGLAYYNLVRVPPNSVHSVELLTIDLDGTAYFNFSRLIKQAVTLMNYEKTRDALEYDCLITLYQSTDMKKVCYQLIVSHITSLDDYKQATGDPSVYQTGYIERLKPLLGVYSMEDEREYNREVLARVANHFKLDHRYKDVVSIDMLMGDFDSALSELNQQLNDAIERYVSYILKYACYSRSSEQDLIQYCTLFIQTHQHQETALSRTCYYLLLILQACTAHQQGRLEDALRFIKQLNVIPFEGQNFVAISHHVDVYNHSLDMMSKKHLPGVILMTLDILASFYKNTLNTSMSLLSQEQGAAMIQQRESYKAGIRSVMSFTGIISADIRPEILQKIHRKITEIH